MKTKEPGERPADPVPSAARQLDSLIGRRVLDALCQPAGTCKLQVRRLWDEQHYRVNLLAGEDAVSTRIVGSYFLVVDGEGNILTATPSLTGGKSGGGP
jgi:hypothetical protein